MFNLKKDFEKVIQKLIPTYQLLEQEQDIEELLKSILNLDDTKVYHSPISGIYYVFNSSLGYNLKITRYSITISNHDFSFQEDLKDSFSQILQNILDEYLEFQVRLIEEEVFKNRKDLLSKMKTLISYKKEVQLKLINNG